MADLPNYSSKKVGVTWGGYTISGLMPENFIEFSLNEDLTSYEVGADTSVSISISPNETGTFTLRLQQQSPANQYLVGILNEQRLAGVLAEYDMSVNDPSGFVAIIRKAHIMTAPTVTRSSSATGSSMDYVFLAKEIHFQAIPPSAPGAAELVLDAAVAVDSAMAFLDNLLT